MDENNNSIPGMGNNTPSGQTNQSQNLNQAPTPNANMPRYTIYPDGQNQSQAQAQARTPIQTQQPQQPQQQPQIQQPQQQPQMQSPVGNVQIPFPISGNVSEGQEANNALINTMGYRGSMQSILAQNVGEYAIIDFLIGTQNIVRKEGILYAVGISYITLYNRKDDTYIVCDLYAIQFVTFPNPVRRTSGSRGSLKMV